MVDRTVTEYAWRAPRRGVARVADRAVLLAHGAGSDMHGAALLAVADALAATGVASLRFNYPYRTHGKGAPDRPAVLDAATREAAAELARRTKLPPERLVLGGRSMGGRYCSMIVGSVDDPVPALGLLLLGYPLHPPGKPDRPRVEHFPRIRVPVLFVSGTRDALASRVGLTAAARKIKGRRQFHWLDTADHGYRPLKSSGKTVDAVLGEVSDVASEWVCQLPEQLTRAPDTRDKWWTTAAWPVGTATVQPGETGVVMAGTEVGRSALDRVEPQRGRLGSALRDYQLAALNPDPDWATKVPGALGVLHSAFEEHVEFTEARDGLFDEMLHDDSIEVSSEIDQLRRDHIVVAAAMARAGEALANPPSEDDHLREIIASVARLVSRHRRRGTQLLYDVYSVDTAAGD